MSTGLADNTRIPWSRKLGIAARDIKLAHSVFAVPFALLGGVLATGLGYGGVLLVPLPSSGAGSDSPGLSWPDSWDRGYGSLGFKFGLIVVCMVLARTFAMLMNRFLDRRLDAENPRTAGRAFAANTLSHRDAVIMLAASASLFAVATAGFGVFFGNWLPVLAGPVVLGWLAFYSVTKRFTLLCHVVLGIALALSPIAAAGAIGGFEAVAFWPRDVVYPGGAAQTYAAGWFDSNADVYTIALFVAAWVAGFDVIYAMQDEAFDREKGLHSMPSRLGTAGAAWASRGLHGVAVGAVFAAGVVSDQLGVLYFVGAGLTAALLIAEHAILAVRGHRSIPMVFFTLNGVVAIVLGVAGIADVLT
ncbi:MAG: UbiA-like polyprenyltransferase [Planctomycetota bacterium]